MRRTCNGTPGRACHPAKSRSAAGARPFRQGNHSAGHSRCPYGGETLQTPRRGVIVRPHQSPVAYLPKQLTPVAIGLPPRGMLYHDPRLSTAPIGRCWQVAWRLCPPIRVCRITLASNPTATGAETADGPRPRNAHSTRRNCRSSRIQLKLGLSQDTRAVRRYRQSASTCDPKR